MTRSPLSTRTLGTLALLAVFVVAGLVRLGDPEPALPHCPAQPAFGITHVRCRP